MAECFQINLSDNVATVMQDAAPEVDLRVLGESLISTLRTTEQIRAGHKIATRPIAADEAIVKYGFVIGEAIRPVACGEWVHLHNCRSRYDARSSELDIETGMRGATPYV